MPVKVGGRKQACLALRQHVSVITLRCKLHGDWLRAEETKISAALCAVWHGEDFTLRLCVIGSPYLSNGRA